MVFPEGMKTKQKIEFVQRYILVHSMLYYEMNTSVISDKKFDKVCRLLVNKQEKLSEERLNSTQYGYVFYDFDGSTGFDLVSRLKKSDRKRIEEIATYVLRLYRLEHKH